MTTLYSEAIGVIGGDFVLLFNLTTIPSMAGSVPIVNLYVENPSVGSVVQDNPDVSVSTTLPSITSTGTQTHTVLVVLYQDAIYTYSDGSSTPMVVLQPNNVSFAQLKYCAIQYSTPYTSVSPGGNGVFTLDCSGGVIVNPYPYMNCSAIVAAYQQRQKQKILTIVYWSIGIAVVVFGIGGAVAYTVHRFRKLGKPQYYQPRQKQIRYVPQQYWSILTSTNQNSPFDGLNRIRFLSSGSKERIPTMM